MQNTNLAEGEESDNEVMVIGEPTRASPQEHIIPITIESSPQKSQDEDKQLKELGLFEEGMSSLHKQEILQVIAASRKSAIWEEDNRKRDSTSIETTPGPSQQITLKQDQEDKQFAKQHPLKVEEKPQVHSENKENDIQPKETGHYEDIVPSKQEKKNLEKTKRLQRIKKIDIKILQEEKERDDQLKELGLYEEGMTRSQKIELMNVIAASRETALQEETLRRQHSRPSLQATTSQSSIPYPSLPSHPPSYAEVCKHDSSNPPVVQEPEDDDTYLSEEEGAIEPSPTTEISAQDSVEEPDDHLEHHTSKEEPDDPNTQEGGGARNMKGWWGCQSSLPSPELKRPQRLLQKSSLKEAVPYFCPDDWGEDPSEYTSFLVEKFNRFHAQIAKVQSTLLNRCPWGKPIIAMPIGPMTRAASLALSEHGSNSPPPILAGYKPTSL